MKKVFTIIVCSLLFIGCKNSEEKTADSILEKIETTVKENANLDVDLKQPSKKELNTAEIEITFGGKTILQNKDFKTYVTLSETGVMIDMNQDRSNKLAVAVSGKETFKNQPISGVFSRSSTGNDKMAVMMGSILEEGEDRKFIPFPSVYEGTLTITKLSEEEIIISIDGRGGLLADMHKEENWQSITGKIICKNPSIAAHKVEKENLFY